MDTTKNASTIARAEAMGWGITSAVQDAYKTDVISRYAVGKVLDCGCATGLYAKELQKQHLSVWGVDSELLLLKKARQRGVSKVVVGDCEHLPFKTKGFDTTILFDVLEHVKEEETLRELIRVTRKRLIITVPRTTDPGLSKNFLVFGHHLDTTHLRTYSVEEAGVLVNKLGLKPLEIKPCHPISIDALLVELFEGSKTVRRGIRKIATTLAKPKMFYTNLLIVADLP